jgi:hypothetical protein
METLFQKLNCRLDPWQPDYGMGYQASSDGDEAWPADGLKCSIEITEDRWSPIKPISTPKETPQIVFVDGVRRIHTRLLQRKESQFFFGAVGSLAAGAVKMEKGRLNTFGDSLLSASVKHALLLNDLSNSDSAKIPLNYPEGSFLHLESHEVSGRDPDEPVNFLQQLMRQEEAAVIRNISVGEKRSPFLIVADGPLNLRLLESSPAVGYIKTLHSLYLPEQLHDTVWSLAKGERSPMFLIQPQDWEEGLVSRYSCYLRIAEPGVKNSVMSGIIRLEVSANMPLEDAKEAFDRCALLLPDFASPWGRDPRAPQNLIPLSALEMELRHKIGHPGLISRILLDQF